MLKISVIVSPLGIIMSFDIRGRVNERERKLLFKKPTLIVMVLEF